MVCQAAYPGWRELTPNLTINNPDDLSASFLNQKRTGHATGLLIIESSINSLHSTYFREGIVGNALAATIDFYAHSPIHTITLLQTIFLGFVFSFAGCNGP